MLPPVTVFDVAIVGAGAAGLAAGQAARARGLSAVILEARDRVGGRAHTEWVLPEVPWDLGCHWVHSARTNPFLARAEALGLLPIPDPARPLASIGRRFLSSDELKEMQVFFQEAWLAVEAAGRAGEDRPASEVLAERGFGDHPYRRHFDMWCASHCGVGPELTSTLDHIRYDDGLADWPVPDGFGRVVVHGAEALDVRTSVPVETLRWGGRSLHLSTPLGTLEARAAIVTASPAALATGAIRFEPELPERHREAAEALLLGDAEKVVLVYPDGPPPVLPRDLMILADRGASPGMGLQVRPYGKPLVSAYVAGPDALALAGLADADAGALVGEALADLFGSKATRRRCFALRTRWSADPYIRGAYSSARPGLAHLRDDLACPVAPNLVIAGEATSPSAYSTVQGAAASGLAALDEVAKALADPS